MTTQIPVNDRRRLQESREQDAFITLLFTTVNHVNERRCTTQHHEPWHDYSALSFNINVPLTCCINCRFPTTISRLFPHSLWTSISKHPINQSTIATSTSLRQTRPVNVCYTYHLPSSRTSTLNFQLISNIIIEQ